MLAALGHCEDPICLQSASHDLVRLFRCSIHCNRNLCLFHLNAHNVYYEEEKKENNLIICELENSLTLYQTIFEKQIQSYRELVQQTSSLLLHNTSAIVPVDQIRPVLEKIQQAIALFQEEKIIIKCEPTCETIEMEKDVSKDENIPFENTPVEPSQKVVLRIRRYDGNTGKESEDESNSSPKYVTRNTRDSMKTRENSVKRLQK